MKLRKYLDEKEVSQSEFADRVGCSQGTISKICWGSLEPSLELAMAIVKETGGEVDFPDLVLRPRRKRP